MKARFSSPSICGPSTHLQGDHRQRQENFQKCSGHLVLCGHKDVLFWTRSWFSYVWLHTPMSKHTHTKKDRERQRDGQRDRERNRKTNIAQEYLYTKNSYIIHLSGSINNQSYFIKSWFIVRLEGRQILGNCKTHCSIKKAQRPGEVIEQPEHRVSPHPVQITDWRIHKTAVEPVSAASHYWDLAWSWVPTVRKLRLEQVKRLTHGHL